MNAAGSGSLSSNATSACEILPNYNFNGLDAEKFGKTLGRIETERSPARFPLYFIAKEDEGPEIVPANRDIA
jgi:hypothetical protein